MITPTIETNRLILRGFRNSDFEAYAKMCADPEIMKYISTGDILSREESWRSMAFMIGHWQLRKFGMWAVEEKETGQFVGRIGLFNPEGWPNIEVAWTLVKKAWGKGYATEAANCSIEWGFKNTNAQELISLIIPENTASIKVSERIGQKFREKTTLKGISVNLYSINKETAT